MAARLFEDLPEPRLLREALGPGTAILNGFASGTEAELVSALRAVVERAPFRHMVTPGGFRMSVAMTNCGRLGWVTDRTGYRYDEIDSETGLQWPAMPPVFARLAAGAAREAGFPLFLPDACLITGMSQARDCRSIRIKMNEISTSPSFRCLSDYRLFFSSAAWNVPIRRFEFR